MCTYFHVRRSSYQTHIYVPTELYPIETQWGLTITFLSPIDIYPLCSPPILFISRKERKIGWETFHEEGGGGDKLFCICLTISFYHTPSCTNFSSSHQYNSKRWRNPRIKRRSSKDTSLLGVKLKKTLPRRMQGTISLHGDVTVVNLQTRLSSVLACSQGEHTRMFPAFPWSITIGCPKLRGTRCPRFFGKWKKIVLLRLVSAASTW